MSASLFTGCVARAVQPAPPHRHAIRLHVGSGHAQPWRASRSRFKAVMSADSTSNSSRSDEGTQEHHHTDVGEQTDRDADHSDTMSEGSAEPVVADTLGQVNHKS